MVMTYGKESSKPWITAWTLVCFCVAVAMRLANSIDHAPPSTRIDRPLGVPLSKKALYEPINGMFRCLDGSASLPISSINDDYCDCVDASDEPGTSACRNGQFYCENKGYVSREIPSSRINDGICDCCDGSDEIGTSIHCSNTCFELGRQLRQEAERQYEVMKTGFEVRQQYIVEAKQMKSKTQIDLQEAEKHLRELEQRKNELDEAKKTAEALETRVRDEFRKNWESQRDEHRVEGEKQRARSLFEFLDTNGDGRVTREDLLPILRIDRQHDLTAEQSAFIAALPHAYAADEWVHQAWPQMKLLIKAEVLERVFNPYGRGQAQSSGQPDTHEPVVAHTPAPAVHHHEQQSNRLPADVEGTDDEDLPDFAPEDHYDDKYGSAIDGDDDDTVRSQEGAADTESRSSTGLDDDEHEPPFDDETQAAVDAATKARDSFRNADNDFLSEQTRVNNMQQSLKNEYGPDDVFWPLHGKCFEYSDREYTYSLCPFDKVSQVGRGGGGHVNLGTWGKWVDNYGAMVFENGMKCWNGPDRSTVVTLQCGIENRLLGASEPNRCVYAATFETPAACPPPPADRDKVIEEALQGAAQDDDMLRHLEL